LAALEPLLEGGDARSLLGELALARGETVAELRLARRGGRRQLLGPPRLRLELCPQLRRAPDPLVARGDDARERRGRRVEGATHLVEPLRVGGKHLAPRPPVEDLKRLLEPRREEGVVVDAGGPVAPAVGRRRRQGLSFERDRRGAPRPRDAEIVAELPDRRLPAAAQVVVVEERPPPPAREQLGVEQAPQPHEP